MATQKQFEFFRSVYDEEEKRADFLNDHAKNNLGLVTFYSAFIIFAVEKMRPNPGINTWLFVAAVLLMLAAFLLSLWATQISNY
jgi:hypothetical protein